MENLTGGTPPVRYLPCVVPCKLYFTAGKGTNRYYEGTYEGNVGEAIILHTENDSKLDGVNLDFSGGKMYYDDDEYTSTDVTTVISKAELYR